MVDQARAELWVQGRPQNGSRIVLSKGVTWIGRATTNNIVVEDSGVSRQHAGIREDRAGYWIKDMGSTNGTYINGLRVRGEGQRLQDNDRIELGSNGSVAWVFKLPAQGDSRSA
ncbi:MAG: FHA domain-containing protein [SAR202 cluster bacterium]|nr:FHA domain-containing protein [SAR202 cluster bacterium]